MKAGLSLDAEISKKIMHQSNLKSKDIPRYTTNIYAAYEVISNMQHQGWSFHIKSKITQVGSLLYHAKFVRNNQHTEQYSPSLPMAICLSALAIANNQYFEYVDKKEKEDDEQSIEIVGASPVKPILKNIDISVESLEELLARRLNEFELPSANGLMFKDILTKEDLRKLPKAFLKFFIDILNENNYCISKKIE